MSHAPDRSSPSPTPAAVPPTPVGILLVEDDAFVRIPLARALSSRGFAVETASRGVEVLPAVEASQPAVIVMDVGLPDASGMDLLGAVVARDPLVSVVMLSGAGEASVASAALDAGATDFVLKPVTADALAAIVRRAAHTRTLRLRQQAQEVARRAELLRRIAVLEAACERWAERCGADAGMPDQEEARGARADAGSLHEQLVAQRGSAAGS